jgi:alpha-N-acetylglucosamine transferase
MLAEEGATVIGVDTLEPSSWHPSPGQARWIDQFTKLRLFELTDYERIAYMDNDMLVARPLDDIWDEEEVINPKATVLDDTKTQLDEAPLPASYVIAGVTDNEGPGNHHPVPVTSTSRLNGGFFVLQPSKGLFEYYKSILEQRGRFDNGMMEMGLLNYAHRLDGNMPWVPLIPGKWSNNWPALRDMELGSATLHDKFWDKGNRGWIEPELVEMWWRVQGQMEGHWQRAREKTVEYL